MCVATFDAVPYSNVKNAHIVPEPWLRLWEVDGKLAVHFVDRPGDELFLPASKVGTRHRAYRRERPNGELIDDGEWSLSKLENAATPHLSEVPNLWPLKFEAKAALAQLFAMQIVRGPRWMVWHDTTHAEAGGRSPVSTSRIMQMLKLGADELTAIVGSMNWTLLEFRKPHVALSDDPIVLWPAMSNSLRPESRPFDPDELAAQEIRIPISPQHLILCTWHDEADDEAPRLACRREHAANLNAFTIAQADKQWFHHPGHEPPRVIGSLLPLAPELLGSFDLAHSKRREFAVARARSLSGELRRGRELELPRVTRTA